MLIASVTVPGTKSVPDESHTLMGSFITNYRKGRTPSPLHRPSAHFCSLEEQWDCRSACADHLSSQGVLHYLALEQKPHLCSPFLGSKQEAWLGNHEEVH